MLDDLSAPDLKLAPKDREYIVKQREILGTDEGRTPGEHLYERLWRIAARCGLVERRRHTTALRTAHRAAVARAREVVVPARYAVGAPIPAPPPLRRPVVALGSGDSESWDPSVAGL
jgi:hypothetical protein